MVKLIKKHHRKIILSVPILFLMITSDVDAIGNSVFLKPTNYFPEVGSAFNVDIKFKSGTAFNATEGTVTYPYDKVRVEKIDTTSSAIELWGSTPEWSNSIGIATWSGGIIYPKLKDGKQEGTIAKIGFIPTTSSPVVIGIKEASLLSANGKADNIIESVSSVKIYPRPKGTPTPDIDFDKKLTSRDITQVILGIGKAYNPKLDINNDKSVNYKDLNQMIVYYNEINK